MRGVMGRAGGLVLGRIVRIGALGVVCAALAAFSLGRIAGMGGSGKGADQPASFETGLRPSTTAGA